MNNDAYQAPQSFNQVVGTDEQTVTIKEWVITILVMAIPLVNIIMMFVWAFGSGYKTSKSNYFKAQLLVAAIMFAIAIVFVLLAIMLGLTNQ